MGRKMKVTQQHTDGHDGSDEQALTTDTKLVDTEYGSFIRVGGTFVLANEIVAVGPSQDILGTENPALRKPPSFPPSTAVLLGQNASGIDFLVDTESSVEEIMLLICEAGTYEDDVAPGDE